MKYDYLIVGCGFAGATLARKLAEEKNKKVLIIDRRNHIGGNSFDYVDKTGVLIHKYGPHYIHTDYRDVWNFLSRFTAWRKYRYVSKSMIDNELYDFPINLNTINKLYDKNLSPSEANKFLEKQRIIIKKPKNSEEQVISQAGWKIYNSLFKNYIKKQWGVDAKELEPLVAARIPIRCTRKIYYFDNLFEGIPKDGYAQLFKNLLNHKNIDIKLKTDFFTNKKSFEYERLVYTGCIDEFFNYKYGRLPYRSLYFRQEHYNKEFYQPYPQINYPNEKKFTRIIEIKHITGQKIKRTTIVKEFPKSYGDPYYPIPAKKNELLYSKYKAEAKKLKNTYFVGRLAQYKYFNMDLVVRESLDLYKKLI